MGRRKKVQEGTGTGDGVSVLDLAAQHSRQCAEAAQSDAKLVFGTGNWSKKVVADSVAVHPDQVEELRALNKRLGVEAEVRPNGQVVFDNSQQIRKYARQHNYRHYGY